MCLPCHHFECTNEAYLRSACKTSFIGVKDNPGATISLSEIFK